MENRAQIYKWYKDVFFLSHSMRKQPKERPAPEELMVCAFFSIMLQISCSLFLPVLNILLEGPEWNRNMISLIWDGLFQDVANFAFWKPTIMLKHHTKLSSSTSLKGPNFI